MTAWADLDKLAVAKPRTDGRATFVARDDRSAEEIAETRHLSTLVAICRVVRGRFAIKERHAGSGVVIYATRGVAPSFLVDAVSAAGGIVFDGAREHTSRAPLATTVQLDAAFCDLASVVRRRVKERTLAGALDVLEHEVRRRALTPADPVGWWTAIIELTALAGEVVREVRPGRWVEMPNERLPVALELGKGEQLMPAKLAQAIAEGSTVSLRSLIDIVKPPPPKPTRAPTARPVEDVPGFARPMPLLCDRNAVPLDRMSWSRLLPEELETLDMPVIVYVDDRAEAIAWPQDLGPPTPQLERSARANLAQQAFELTAMPLPFGKVVIVTGGFYGAEALLDPATMEKVRAELSGTELMLVAVPARGHLVAIDGVIATVDDDFQRAFLMMVEGEYIRAAERDRISSEVLLYVDRPVGRVQSNLMDSRRALRRIGVDPDV